MRRNSEQTQFMLDCWEQQSTEMLIRGQCEIELTDGATKLLADFSRCFAYYLPIIF